MTVTEDISSPETRHQFFAAESVPCHAADCDKSVRERNVSCPARAGLRPGSQATQLCADTASVDTVTASILQPLVVAAPDLKHLPLPNNPSQESQLQGPASTTTNSSGGGVSRADGPPYPRSGSACGCPDQKGGESWRRLQEDQHPAARRAHELKRASASMIEAVPIALAIKLPHCHGVHTGGESTPAPRR